MMRLGIYSTIFTLLFSGCGFGSGSSAVTNVFPPGGNTEAQPAPVFEIRPGNIQVPDTEVNCQNAVMLEIVNTGNAPGAIDLINVIGAPEFAVNMVSLPALIQPGAIINLTLEFSPTSIGNHRATLLVEDSTAGVSDSSMVIAEAVGPIETLDTFTQETKSADILLVVDNSCSMYDDIAHLQQQLPQMLQELDQEGIDYQIGIVPVSVASSANLGLLAGTTPIITPNTQNAGDLLEANLLAAFRTSGAPVEEGFEVAKAAFDGNLNQGFRRAGARLVITFISDEDDQGTLNVADSISLLDRFAGGRQNLVLNAIVGDVPNGCASAAPGNRYVQATNAANGVFSSICSSNWSSALTNLGPFTMKQSFTLSRAPDVNSIEVTVEGLVAAPSDYRYDTNGNQITFQSVSTPAPGAVVEIRYSDVQMLCGGQAINVEVTPNPLDFGTNNTSCSSSTLTASIHNRSAIPVLVTDIALSAQTSLEFRRSGVDQLWPAITLPQMIPAGQSFDFDVVYAPRNNGVDQGQINILVHGTRAIALPLIGGGTSIPSHSEDFRQVMDPKGDILFVVDTSCSMANDASKLQVIANDVITNLTALGIDYQVAVTTMATTPNTTPGQLVGTNPIVTDRMANPAQELQANIFPGINSSTFSEEGFVAAENAITANPSLLRPDAWLTTIFISDETEQSSDTVQQVADRLTGLKGFKGQQRVQANSIVEWPTACFGSGQASGARYAEVAQLTGGVTDSLCGNTWTNALNDFGGTGYGLKTNFQLQNTPKLTSIEVIVNGVVIPQQSNSIQNWIVNFTDNTLVFLGAAIPSPGAQITINYDEDC